MACRSLEIEACRAKLGQSEPTAQGATPARRVGFDYDTSDKSQTLFLHMVAYLDRNGKRAFVEAKLNWI